MQLTDEKHSNREITQPLLVLAVGALIGLSGIGSTFAPGTTINDRDVSRMTVTAAKQALASDADAYVLDLSFRDGDFKVTSDDIGLRLNSNTSLRKLMWSQLRSGDRELEFYIPDLYQYDEAKLQQRLSECPALDTALMKAPENASLSYDKEADVFKLEAGAPGTVLDARAFAKRVGKSISFMQPSLDADRLGFYEEAVLTPDGALSQKVLEEADALTKVNVEYLFHDAKTEKVNRAFMGPLICLNEDLQPQIDQGALKKKIKKMVKRHPAEEATIYFTTTGGDRIPFTYPAEDDEVDQKAFLKDILKSVKKHRKGLRTVAYTGEAAKNDHNFGGNYIEVDLENQVLYLYKDGEMVMQTDVVTGSTRKYSRMTPTGVYKVYNMMRNVTLKGDDYESDVSYWMPFRGGYGLHDAPWRSRFGGSIYTYNGSHGCVNMPTSKARELYETIDVGYRVVVYDAGMKESDDDED